MLRWTMTCVVVIVATCVVASAEGAINQRMIAQVASGKVKVARASWWGFDAEDSTEALQAAINSGARRLIVDNTGKPWIVRPITLAGDQTIVFSRGVEVIAKRREFMGKGDSLFSASEKRNITLIGYGATLRMHRSDYDKPPYEKAEWRHALRFHGCTNVKVYGLTLTESGGDGIYLGTGPGGMMNRDIHIKDVTCSRNYRQGISVITAENLRIENTVMRDTAGTAPQAGIDFEPNEAGERLINVVMRRCTARGNAGVGYAFYLPPLKATSQPISIRIEDCASIGDSYSVFIATGNAPGDAVKGSIEFANCTFEGGRHGGVLIENKPVGGCALSFEKCSILDPAAGSPVLLRSRRNATEPVGGIEFRECLVRDASGRAPIAYDDSAAKVPTKAISGAITLERDGEREHMEITAEHLASP